MLSLFFELRQGVIRALVCHGVLLAILTTGFALRIRLRWVIGTAFVSLLTACLAGRYKAEGVVAIQGLYIQRDQDTFVYGLLLLLLEVFAVTLYYLVRGLLRYFHVNNPRWYRPPRQREFATWRNTVIWSGSILAISLVYAVTILVLPRFLPNLDPDGARRLEYRRQFEAWRRNHGHSGAPVTYPVRRHHPDG